MLAFFLHQAVDFLHSFLYKRLRGRMSLVFSPHAQQQIEVIRKQYPTSQAACMPVLHLAQEEFGYLSDEVLDLVSVMLGLPHAHVFGVATFYTMYHRKPVGKKVLMMCTNVSCMLRGADQTMKALEDKLGIVRGQTTPDGEFTLIEEECLAACANAPALVCGDRYFLDFTADKVDDVLRTCRNLPASHTSTEGSHVHGA